MDTVLFLSQYKKWQNVTENVKNPDNVQEMWVKTAFFFYISFWHIESPDSRF